MKNCLVVHQNLSAYDRDRNPEDHSVSLLQQLIWLHLACACQQQNTQTLLAANPNNSYNKLNYINSTICILSQVTANYHKSPKITRNQ